MRPGVLPCFCAVSIQRLQNFPTKISGAPRLHSALFSGPQPHRSPLPELASTLASFLPSHATSLFCLGFTSLCYGLASVPRARNRVNECRGGHAGVFLSSIKALKCLLYGVVVYDRRICLPPVRSWLDPKLLRF